MMRIGLAYNRKPDAAPQLLSDDSDGGSRADDEPPSKRRDDPSRTSRSPAHAGEDAPASAALSRTAARPHHSRSAPPAASGSPAHSHGDATTPRAAAVPSSPALPAPSDAYAEWDEEETIAAVEHALGALGEVVRLEADADFPMRLRTQQPAIVFNMAEGWNGPNREAHVPAICEFYGIPYSGSDPFTLSLCLDKARTKEWLAAHGVPTAPFVLVRTADDLERLRTHVRARATRREGTGSRTPMLRNGIAGGSGATGGALLQLPAFVKPVHEGSSKGITERNLCRTTAECETQVAELLERYRQPVLVEEYLPGAEFTCAVLGNDASARVLPIVGMNFSALPEGALPVYGFEAKWLWDTPEHPLPLFECPARIDEETYRRIEAVALSAYGVLGCRDWSRVDVRLDATGTPNVVEVNPLPGILPDPDNNSCFPKAARAAGMTYDELIRACLMGAAARLGIEMPPPLGARSSNAGTMPARSWRAAALG